MKLNVLFVLFFYPLMVFSKWKIPFLKDYFKINRADNIVEAHLCWNKDKHFLKYPIKWLIFGNMTTLKNSKYDIPVNSYIMVVEPGISTESLLISSLYNLKDKSKYFVNTVALWKAQDGFLYFHTIIPSRDRWNFHGMPMTVSYVITDNRSSSDSNIYDNRYKLLDKTTVINLVLYNHFVDIWNMTHKKIYRSDWGLQFDPIKHFYSGMMGDIYNNHADVAGCKRKYLRNLYIFQFLLLGTIQYTPSDRLKYFKYLVSTTRHIQVCIIYRAPPLAYSENLFVIPFDDQVWIGCGIILTACCIVIWLIMRWESNVRNFKANRHESLENAPSFLDIVMMNIGALCQMDYFNEPRSIAGKIAIFSLLFSFSYIYTAFCARIVILLQSTAGNFRDFSDALYEANMGFGVEKTPYNVYYFTVPNPRINEEWRRRIYETKLAPDGKPPIFYSSAEGMKLVQNSFFAFHVEQTTAGDLISATFTEQEKCSTRKIPSLFQGDVPYIACNKNSTLIEFFMIGFFRLFETGVFERESRRRYLKLPKCLGNKGNFFSVGLIECYFAFTIFLIGLALSLLTFILEIIISKTMMGKLLLRHFHDKRI
ncbi:hypothetical protein ABEB36_010405 [Hypothenemus hampei]|uniref:Uncharacterized protein n=1 Tax=Hypothenemus hampei TaxID=57062 RepID=A0ABD1EMJ6_HYPHA